MNKLLFRTRVYLPMFLPTSENPVFSQGLLVRTPLKPSVPKSNLPPFFFEPLKI